MLCRSFCVSKKFPRIVKSYDLIPTNLGGRFYSTLPGVSREYIKNDAVEFKSVFQRFAKDLVEQVKKYDDTVAPDWFEKSLKYNVFGGKNNRGQMTVLAFKLLANETQLTNKNIELAQYVGWCSEMFEAALFLVDDILDASETRRGLPCWYKLEEVKNNSLNDIIMLENGVFTALKSYIGHTDYYPEIVRMFNEANFVTSLGQTLDFLITRENVTKHTMEKYRGIVKYKTCHSAFYLPVAFALTMCGYKDPKIYEDAKNVFIEIGLFFQTRNDYLDSFGEMTETGKGGTDIQENKISWMAIKALEKANMEQKRILETCYGQKDVNKVMGVQSLFKELGIDQEFLEYEKDSYRRIKEQIEGSNYENLKMVLNKVWDIIYYKI